MSGRKAAAAEVQPVRQAAAKPKATPKATKKKRTVEGDGIYLYSAEEVANRLKIGRTLVYYLVGRGELESVKINGLRRITRDGLERYIAGLVALTSRRSA